MTQIKLILLKGFKHSFFKLFLISGVLTCCQTLTKALHTKVQSKLSNAWWHKTRWIKFRRKELWYTHDSSQLFMWNLDKNVFNTTTFYRFVIWNIHNHVVVYNCNVSFQMKYWIKKTLNMYVCYPHLEYDIILGIKVIRCNRFPLCLEFYFSLKSQKVSNFICVLLSEIQFMISVNKTNESSLDYVRNSFVYLHLYYLCKLLLSWEYFFWLIVIK